MEINSPDLPEPQNDPNYHYDQVFGWVAGGDVRTTEAVYRGSRPPEQQQEPMLGGSSPEVIPPPGHHQTTYEVKINPLLGVQSDVATDKKDDLPMLLTIGGIALFCAIVFVLFCTVQ